MKVILALDLGAKTGWACRCSDGSTLKGLYTHKQSRFEGGGIRYVHFQSFLEQCHPRPDCVYFEAVRAHAGVDAAHAYGGYLATLMSWCERHCIPYEGVGVGTIKKHATGKGNASKADMIDAMIRQGYFPKDDNEADALALLLYVIDQKDA